MVPKCGRRSKPPISVLVAGVLAAAAIMALPISTSAVELVPRVPLADLYGVATLPPIGHSRFCLRYAYECEVHGIDFRHRNIVMTPQRWNELNFINLLVNRNIAPMVSRDSAATEGWLIWPAAGDCKNYAITKRHELLRLGWPSRALLLSEVVLPSGEHHLLLVVRLKDADLVLDNLNDDLRLVQMTYGQYLWVRVQSTRNPRFWVRVLGVLQTVTASN